MDKREGRLVTGFLFIFLVIILLVGIFKSGSDSQTVNSYEHKEDVADSTNSEQAGELANNSKNVLQVNNLNSRLNHPLLSKATFTYMRPFLLSVPQTIKLTEPPQFLTDVKNPCFALDDNFINVGNIDLATAIAMGFEVKCLPYVYLAGVSKCGTTDLHANLIKHQLLFGVATTRKLDKYSNHIGDSNYRSTKETHYWDNRHCGHNRSIESFVRNTRADAIVDSYIKYRYAPYDPEIRDDFRQMLYIESTPRQSWHHDSWNEERLHWGRSEPFEFTPDRIHHATPDAKIIFLLRDPVARTFSDYKYLTSSKSYHSAEDFHRKVVDSITWWKNCTLRYTERACAYGNAPPGLPAHNSPSCGLQAFLHTPLICNDYKSWGCNNAIDRFRISFYDIFLAEWLRVFPRENILILRTEELGDRIGLIMRILDFLKLPALRQDIYDEMAQSKSQNNKSKTYITMLNETKTILEDFFKPMNRNLADMLDLEEPFW